MDIAVTNRSGRNTKNWLNKQMEWPALKKRLSETMYTLETVKEYHAMPKSEQAEKKDHGGFVGGYLVGGKRSPNSVKHRQVLCLDADSASDETYKRFIALYPVESLIYTTHSHTPDKPRIRLIIPLSEPVTPDQYKAITRLIAEQVGMEDFDATTFQAERLMYWPTTPKGGEFYCHTHEGPFLTPAAILNQYTDPEDISSWPLHPNESKIIARSVAKQGSPADKEGPIGAFCRAYSVYDAIDTLLPDLYEETVTEDRYTYTKGTSAAGAIVYNGGDFLYSHHSTDPTQGQLVNSFDLVRIHKFGGLDIDSKVEKTGSLPSSKKMMAWIITLPEVTSQSVQADFSEWSEEPEVDLTWVEKLTLNRQGEVDSTIPNFELIIDNDPRLKGRFYYDEFEDRTFGKLPLPWEAGDRYRDLKDIDDSNLESFISKEYKIHHSTNIKKAFDNVCYRYKVHPVRDYLDQLVWDGVPRVENLLIEFMGADDTEYVRTVMRKSLAACVTRIYYPGTKFDNVIILVGDEGIYKSTLIAKLGQKWFSDSFMGVTGLEAMQQLQGAWIMEIPELAAIKKSEVTAIKSFLSKTMDRYRSSYGRRNNTHPRQVVFFGTTNERTPLRGDTGNRRFWPVHVKGVHRSKFEQLDVDQVWAEAKHIFNQGEDLDLPDNIQIEAKKIQRDHTEMDSRGGIIGNFLEMPLPDNWDTLGLQERRQYINHDSTDELMPRATNRRDIVCAAEIHVELFGQHAAQMDTYRTKYIHETMANMPGWERTANNINFSYYGRQIAYVRLNGDLKVKLKKEHKETY